MMRSFMTSGSLTWGAELNKGPNGSDMTPLPEENAVMTVYGGRPPSGRHRMSILSPRGPTHCGWEHGGSGVWRHKFSIILIKYPCVCVCVYSIRRVYTQHSYAQTIKLSRFNTRDPVSSLHSVAPISSQAQCPRLGQPRGRL
jgi:hypothetical protein